MRERFGRRVLFPMSKRSSGYRQSYIMRIGFSGNGDKRQTVAVGQNASF